jgi:hypothetical protein
MITTCNKHPVSSIKAPASHEALPSKVDLVNACMPNNNFPMRFFAINWPGSVLASLVRIVGYAYIESRACMHPIRDHTNNTRTRSHVRYIYALHRI